LIVFLYAGGPGSLSGETETDTLID
jgi:hypothetical protein